jgi:hypothetical protein
MANAEAARIFIVFLSSLQTNRDAAELKQQCDGVVSPMAVVPVAAMPAVVPAPMAAMPAPMTMTPMTVMPMMPPPHFFRLDATDFVA